VAFIELPAGLVLKANVAGVSAQAVAEEAIRTKLALRAARLGGDDLQRHRDGVRVGRRWARTVATVAELASLAVLAEARWRDFRLESSHSLSAVLAEEGLVTPTAGGEAWLSRGPFADGVVAAAVEAMQQR
jgi:hypothetical protein